jgi:hypothetical protein
MTKIRIATQNLTSAVEWHFRYQPWKLGDIVSELNHAIGQLDTGAWAEAGCGGGVQSKLNQVGPEGLALAEGIVEMCRTLKTVADKFEEADYTLGRERLEITWIEWPSPSDANPSFAGLPAADRYGHVKGRRFIVGAGDGDAVHPSDVDQGGLGDCYLMSSLAALALRQEGIDLIKSNIRPNEDGTYTVILYERNPWTGELEPVEVRVTPDFPLRADGSAAFAGFGDKDGDQEEFWVMLYEKAYAQHHGSYLDIKGGWGYEALETITGTPSESLNPADMTYDEFKTRFDAGEAITTSSLPDSDEVLDGEWKIPIVRIPDLDLVDTSIFGSDVNLQVRDGKLQLDVDFTEAWETNPWYTGARPQRLIANHAYYVIDVGKDAQGRDVVYVKNPHNWNADTIAIPWEEFQGAFQEVSFNPIRQ